MQVQQKEEPQNKNQPRSDEVNKYQDQKPEASAEKQTLQVSLPVLSDEDGNISEAQALRKLQDMGFQKDDLKQTTITNKPKSYVEIYQRVVQVQSRDLKPGTVVKELKGYPNSLKTYFGTKSCHQCQEQHIKWRCPKAADYEGGKYRDHYSFCLYCLTTWYNRMTVEYCVEHGCPYCQGMCNCRRCLRTYVPEQLTFDDQQQQACQQYLLNFIAHFLIRVLVFEQQALQYNTQLEEQLKLNEYNGMNQQNGINENYLNEYNKPDLYLANGKDVVVSDTKYNGNLETDTDIAQQQSDNIDDVNLGFDPEVAQCINHLLEAVDDQSQSQENGSMSWHQIFGGSYEEAVNRSQEANFPFSLEVDPRILLYKIRPFYC
eukprot:TRINITY_DN4891_c0_g1_i8.p1 TRINITY_DN4891_c0_g1~~TRINITY_DN4891_c0_g1_i8.p1  ORF type:complete len:374 (-),score=31.02 TRINITY_DN4891_c0_g1_i8:3-1124(-)